MKPLKNLPPEYSLTIEEIKEATVGLGVGSLSYIDAIATCSRDKAIRSVIAEMKKRILKEANNHGEESAYSDLYESRQYVSSILENDIQDILDDILKVIDGEN